MNSLESSKLTFNELVHENQQLRTQLDAWHSQFGTSQLSHAIAERDALRTQLAAAQESQKNFRERMEKAIIELERQLAAAQAVIATFRRNWTQVHKAIRSDIMVGEAGEEIHALSELSRQEFSTAALDAAIAEGFRAGASKLQMEAEEGIKQAMIDAATKPLVDTLKQLRSQAQSEDWSERMDIIDAATASGGILPSRKGNPGDKEPCTPSPLSEREHITDGSPCWCNPEIMKP